LSSTMGLECAKVSDDSENQEQMVFTAPIDFKLSAIAAQSASPPSDLSTPQPANFGAA